MIRGKPNSSCFIYVRTPTFPDFLKVMKSNEAHEDCSSKESQTLCGGCCSCCRLPVGHEWIFDLVTLAARVSQQQTQTDRVHAYRKYDGDWEQDDDDKDDDALMTCLFPLISSNLLLPSHSSHTDQNVVNLRPPNKKPLELLDHPPHKSMSAHPL